MEKRAYSDGQGQRGLYADPNMLEVRCGDGMHGAAPVPGAFWPCPGLYQQPPPPPQAANQQRYVPPEWAAFTSHPEHSRPDPRFRPPVPLGFNCEPPDFSMRDFDPTRPPPSFSPEAGRQHSEASRAAEAPFSRTFGQPGFGAPRPAQGAARHGRDYVDREAPAGRWQDGGQPAAPQPSAADAESAQRRLDEQWILTFLLGRSVKKPPAAEQPDGHLSVCQMKERLYEAARLVSDLSLLCQTLGQHMEDEAAWTEWYGKATALRSDLQERLKMLGDADRIDACRKKVEAIRRKRARMRRKKRQWSEERAAKQARALEMDALIDKWRMKRVQEVEEKKRELELRQAADSVLSEVRKKQADAKRMTDILRSLEKLRRLRKEAAAKRGIHPEKEADEAFEDQLDRLRKLIRKRAVVYAAEEKALQVMLEGEREEERRREREGRRRKEREKQLQKKREVEALLFGDEMPPDHPLQPFRQYYMQAENSLHTLIQTRREWDQYLVPSDHPDGSLIPQSWVLPELPSDEMWATALDKQDAGGD